MPRRCVGRRLPLLPLLLLRPQPRQRWGLVVMVVMALAPERLAAQQRQMQQQPLRRCPLRSRLPWL